MGYLGPLWLQCLQEKPEQLAGPIRGTLGKGPDLNGGDISILGLVEEALSLVGNAVAMVMFT